MKAYPSIGTIDSGINEYVTAFIKYDGSNIRVEWNQKNGFNKFGTRTRLLDHTDKEFGSVPDLFNELWRDKLTNLMKDKFFRQFREAVFFFEYFGEFSFAGKHNEKDKKTLVLIDVNLHKKGFMAPNDFVDYFGDMEYSAEVVYKGKCNEDFVQSVIGGGFDIHSKYDIRQYVTEGVVCKSGGNHDRFVAKIKTDFWKSELKTRYADSWQTLV